MYPTIAAAISTMMTSVRRIANCDANILMVSNIIDAVCAAHSSGIHRIPYSNVFVDVCFEN